MPDGVNAGLWVHAQRRQPLLQGLKRLPLISSMPHAGSQAAFCSSVQATWRHAWPWPTCGAASIEATACLLLAHLQQVLLQEQLRLLILPSCELLLLPHHAEVPAWKRLLHLQLRGPVHAARGIALGAKLEASCCVAAAAGQARVSRIHAARCCWQVHGVGKG
jgi:hypothetical protein